MELLDGKKISQQIKNDIKVYVNKLVTEKKRIPQLVVIIVGEDYASHIYVKNKIKACQECGIKGKIIHFPESIKEQEILKEIANLNEDETVDGILVQLPLAKHLDELKILNAINVNKDVDGLTNVNAGKLLQGDNSAIIPCTVKGIISLLSAYNIHIKGQDIAIINNSNIVGKPLAMWLSGLGATVSIANKDTKNLTWYLKTADIIITATGVHQLFNAQDVKQGVVIIDVAITNHKNQKIVGDVDIQTLKQKAKAITPVPGGVGPMTIAMLLKNLLDLYQANQAK